MALATSTVPDEVCATTVDDYAPDVDARELAAVLGELRTQRRTRWVDELVQRCAFHRSICRRDDSKAARFVESELTKNVFFLRREQRQRRSRASALFEADPLVVRARIIEEHWFDAEFHIGEPVARCHARRSDDLARVSSRPRDVAVSRMFATVAWKRACNCSRRVATP